MKIKFIGTSNSNPYPDRGQTCVYFECNSRGHLVDCGDGAATKLWLDPEIDWSRFRALLVTHLHPDHVGGAFCFLHLLKLMAMKNPSWDIHRDEDFKFCMPKGRASKKVTGALPALHLDRERLSYNLNFEFYSAGCSFEAGTLDVLPLPTSHTENAHGFTVTAEGKRVVFSGDLGEPQDITEHENGADLVICECTHFHPRELVRELLTLEAKHYVITHLHDKLLKNIDGTKELFAPLARQSKFTLAYDGLVLELD